MVNKPQVKLALSFAVLLFVVSTFSCINTFGQSIVRGKVIGLVDKKPISNVNVFLSNATIGDKTSNNGTFTLQGIKPGNYTLVVSMVGYDTYSQSIKIGNESITLPDIEIISKAISLRGVVIKPRNDVERDRYFNLFKAGFLGHSELAADSKIVNPEVLDFDYDNTTNTLKASTTDFLTIENNALGYHLKYLVSEFVVDKDERSIQYNGSVLFEKMKGTPSQERRWLKKCQEVYEGSEMHFLRSLLKDHLDEDGYRVLQYSICKNPQRPPDSVINRKIEFFKKQKTGQRSSKDSLSFWKSKLKLPVVLKTLIHFPLRKEDVFKNTDQTGIYALGCDYDGLFVQYNKHGHFSEYPPVAELSSRFNYNVTLVSFTLPYILFDSNGWVINPDSRTFDGGWGRYRVAGLLPSDYEPVQTTTQPANDEPGDTQTVSIDSISQKMTIYAAKKSQTVLFAHFDKNVYAQNENVWFTAYLLNTAKNDLPDVLSVSLVNDLSRSVVLEQQFVMADGIAYGNLFLPDSIPAGNYSFMLYTNQMRNDKPDDVFIQPITLKSAAEPAFKASLALDTSAISSSDQKAIFTVLTKDGRPIPDAIVNFKITGGKDPSKPARIKTDYNGKGIITIPKDENINMVEAQVKFNKDAQTLRLVLPSRNKKISVRFYPEGGYLVHATPGWVGWETKTAEGAAIRATGVLYRDDRPVDTIETDGYGLGRFKLVPMANSRYRVKLLGKSFGDSIYKLPSILARSVAITIPKAIADDTLKVKITSKYPETETVIVHNYRQVFYTFKVETNAAGRMVLVDLKPIPKGLATVTVLDSAGRPCAERMFFAHYNKRADVNIETDKRQYTKREKVNLSLKFETPDTGFVSVACVQSNRLQIKNSNDIESYFYLKNELGTLPLKERYLGNSDADKAYLENILLVKGWRRYTWQEMMQTIPSDTILKQNLQVFTGTVTYLGKTLKKPVRLVVMTDSTSVTVTTDKTGNFVLDNNSILTNENKKVHFLIVARDIDDYKITVVNPFKKIAGDIAKELQLRPDLSYNYNTDSLAIKGLEHAIALKEIKITASKNSNNIHGLSYGYTSNTCGDYVCRFHVLNCVNHRNELDNVPPRIGETYVVSNRGLVEKIIYQGCSAPDFHIPLVLDGIKYSQEFYGSDYSVLSPSQPEYLSTIYWKHLVKLDASNPTKLSFYTSDIKGPFKIIVQGITQNDVVYGEREFDVR